MPPAPYREIYRPPSSRANSKPRAIFVRAMSPEEEYVGWTDEPGDPATAGLSWSPTSWVAEKATAAVDLLADAGLSILSGAVDFAKDLAGTMGAALTGQAPGTPGPIFETAAGVAESLGRIIPGALKKAIGITPEQTSAGWIQLPDGRKIAVPKAADPVAQGEKALGDTLRAALQKANLEAATAKAKNTLELRKLETSSDQWDQAFALKERQAGQAERLGDLQIRAVELALERETTSQPQRALYGRPSTIDLTKEQPQKVVRAVGLGVPGGVATGYAAWSMPW
jgi:hypothetical protein